LLAKPCNKINGVFKDLRSYKNANYLNHIQDRIKGLYKVISGMEKDIEQDAGWMVYFPSGASIHVWTKEEMERQGFLRNPSLVNMDTGDEVGPMSDTSLKSRACRPKTTIIRAINTSQVRGLLNIALS